MYNLKFDVYFKDMKTGRIELEGMQIVKKECYINIAEYKYPFIYFPFLNVNSGQMVRQMLSERVIPPDRGDMDEILKANNIPEYNFYTLLEYNHGIKYDDFTWFKFDHLPNDKNLTYNDVKVRD